MAAFIGYAATDLVAEACPYVLNRYSTIFSESPIEVPVFGSTRYGTWAQTNTEEVSFLLRCRDVDGLPGSELGLNEETSWRFQVPPDSFLTTGLVLKRSLTSLSENQSILGRSSSVVPQADCSDRNFVFGQHLLVRQF